MDCRGPITHPVPTGSTLRHLQRRKQGARRLKCGWMAGAASGPRDGVACIASIRRQSGDPRSAVAGGGAASAGPSPSSTRASSGRWPTCGCERDPWAARKAIDDAGRRGQGRQERHSAPGGAKLAFQSRSAPDRCLLPGSWMMHAGARVRMEWDTQGSKRNAFCGVAAHRRARAALHSRQRDGPSRPAGLLSSRVAHPAASNGLQGKGIRGIGRDRERKGGSSSGSNSGKQ